MSASDAFGSHTVVKRPVAEALAQMGNDDNLGVVESHLSRMEQVVQQKRSSSPHLFKL